VERRLVVGGKTLLSTCHKPIELKVLSMISVFNTPDLLQPFFTSRASAKKLQQQAQGILQGEDGLWSWLAETRKQAGQYGYPVMEAASLDGFDALLAQQMWGLFNPSRRPEASAWAFAQFRQADSLQQVEHWLRRLAEYFGPLAPQQLEVVMVPADPANRNLMVQCHGLSAYAHPGRMLIQLWPSAGNLARLGAVVSRLFVQAMRWQMLQGRTARLADYLVMEGLAAALVEEGFPDEPLPWLVALRKPGDWQDALGQIAQIYGLDQYSQLRTNIYGNVSQVGEVNGLEARTYSADELEYARAICEQALQETDPRQIAAYLYGDEFVRAKGHSGVGMPLFGGLEVAYRLVQVYLARVEPGGSMGVWINRTTEDVVYGSDFFSVTAQSLPPAL
jgi:uncharacterized protein YjaZ